MMSGPMAMTRSNWGLPSLMLASISSFRNTVVKPFTP